VCLATLEGHSNCVTSVAFSRDGRHIALGLCDETVKVWDTESGECLATLEGHSNWVISVAFLSPIASAYFPLAISRPDGFSHIYFGILR
jgi:WD40 repeat protein